VDKSFNAKHSEKNQFIFAVTNSRFMNSSVTDFNKEAPLLTMEHIPFGVRYFLSNYVWFPARCIEPLYSRVRRSPL